MGEKTRLGELYENLKEIELVIFNEKLIQ